MLEVGRDHPPPEVLATKEARPHAGGRGDPGADEIPAEGVPARAAQAGAVGPGDQHVVTVPAVEFVPEGFPAEAAPAVQIIVARTAVKFVAPFRAADEPVVAFVAVETAPKTQRRRGWESGR